MPLTTLISSNEAAQMKACTRQAILDAIERGAIDGQKVGRNFLVRKNGKFERWKPNPRSQKAGREAHRSDRKKG
jgi:hypothetical protein